MIAPASPFCLIRSSQQGIDFRTREKLDRGARKALAWNGQHPLDLGGIDIGRRSPVVPVTPPCVRVRTRRFGGLSYRPEANRKRPIPSKKALGKAMHKAGL